MLECQSCGGRYEPIGADGVRYFHVCPPLSTAEIRAKLADRSLTLSVTNRARLKTAKDADAADPPKDGAASREELLLASLVVERDNKRDENVVQSGHDGKPDVIKAAGAGVLAVADVDAPAIGAIDGI